MVDATSKAAELAAELEIDLANVKGSGKDGRVLVKDVRVAAEPPPVPKRRTPAKIVASLERRAHVLDVFGPFGSLTLIELPTELAMELLQKPLALAGPTNVVDAVERDLAAIREHKPDVADSSLAATAVRLAYELQNPFNSATSKSMCARSLLEVLNRLRELAPPEQEADGLDDLSARRAARRAGKARAAR